MNLINLTSTASPMLHGGIGYETGVDTCNLCGRQCKGHRGLQAHLRAWKHIMWLLSSHSYHAWQIY